VSGIRCTANLLKLLGVPPYLGRNFLSQEDLPGNDRVVIISERCWQKRFGGKDDIIGQTLRVDGQPHEIVGVLPASFNDWRHLGWVDFFRPLGFDKDRMTDRRNTILRVLGRRSASLSRTQADAFIANFGAHLAKDFPEVNAGSSWRAVSLVSWSVFAWALGASLITAIAFGMASALFALRLNVNETLKSGGRGTTGDRGDRRFRQFLIVGQFALAMVLLAGAAVFIRGLDELNHRRAGWQSEHLITGTIVLPAASYPDDEQVRNFHRLMLQRLQATPEVASASVSSFTPFFDWPDIRKYILQGRALPSPGHELAAGVNTVSYRYFETVGTRILAGRSFDERDTATSPKVIIISRATAQSLFGNESALGKRLAQTGATGWSGPRSLASWPI
jgi:hypothetical protein